MPELILPPTRERPSPRQVPATDERWKALRAPFPPSQLGHKPQPWCSECSKAPSRVCSNHQKRKCQTCGNNMTTAHIDLDFIGHAAVTQRLLEVDPHWSWRAMTPVERNEGGYPDPGESGMWIWLTVLGETRPGLGETDGSQLKGANAIKARMSDAIKNAAMRFGVAIQTWSKEDLSDEAALAAEKADAQAHEAGADERATQEQQRLKTISEVTSLPDLQKLYDQARANNLYNGATKEAFIAKRKEITDKEQAKAATPEENPGEAAPEGSEPQ